MTPIGEIIYQYLKLGCFCFIYANIYPFIDKILKVNQSYQNLRHHKKQYVIKNIWKSIVMFYLCIITLPEMKNIFYYQIFNMNLIRSWGITYVANDLTALYMVDKLPSNTRNHHMMSGLLLSIVFMFEGDDSDMVKFIVIYTIFSYMAFLVNLYLAFRFLTCETSDFDTLGNRINQSIDTLRHFAYYNYGITLFLNWSYHLYYFIFMISCYKLSHLIYIGFLIPIIKDDLILLKWLRDKSGMNF